jgi:hypothetical protein
VKKKSHSRRQTKKTRFSPPLPTPTTMCVCVCVCVCEASMERNGAKSTNGSSHTKSKRRIIDSQHDPVFFLPSFPCFSVITTHLAPFFLVCCKSQVPIYLWTKVVHKIFVKDKSEAPDGKGQIHFAIFVCLYNNAVDKTLCNIRLCNL